MSEPNFRVEANRLMGCRNMSEDGLREEIMFSLMDMYSKGMDHQPEIIAINKSHNAQH